VTDYELKLANALSEEIREMELFLRAAERVWTGKIVKETTKYILKSHPYGALKEREFELDTDLKNKVLELLRDELLEKKYQLKNI